MYYAVGALIGGLCGGRVQYSSLVRSGFSTTSGDLLFTGADLIALPTLHLSGAHTDFLDNSYPTPFAALFVYEAMMEHVRRVVRVIL